MRYTRQQVLERLHAQLAAGKPIVGAGAGTGISAKFAEAGGADLIIIYNSGRYRMAGHGSLSGLLAFGDANQIVYEMGEREVLPVVKEVPVVAGVNGTDPLRQMPHFLRRLDDLGFSGINNFPTVGLIDGRFRAELEATNLGFAREVEMIRLAHELGFFTIVYVFNPQESAEMARAGADVVIAHMGLTVGGSIGLDREGGVAMKLEEAPARVQAIGAAAWSVNRDILLVSHGGPIATPEDARYVQERSGAVGFIGASSMERLPVETAITETVRQFKQIPIQRTER
ncbi:MAG TPA: phosphoenolpyruvate hydrolase family protein [Chloroflexota bacterium]|jgi:predicted TIM-barrel enzyme|nr:phosphoenolpyruvate hydrolase family protein [Chloroflexota bacterium]